MKLDKLNKKMEKQFVNDAKELIAIMQDQFGSEKDFDVINYNLTLTFTVNGEERYIEMKTPFNVDDNEE
jgi:polygalacturonase